MSTHRFAVGLLISVSVLAGCSAEPSAQEKRNLYDKCVLDYIDENRTSSISQMRVVEARAPFECSYLLG
jgi:hypothetical protein